MLLATKQMKAMASRKPASTTVDYKTENSFRKKYKQVEFLLISLLTRRSKQEAMTEIKKILGLIKNLTPGEIKILKGKGKRILWMLLDKYAKYEFAQCPPLRDFVQAAVDLFDAVSDETLASEGTKILIEGLEIIIGKINLNSVPLGLKSSFEWGIEYFSQIEEIIVREIKRLGLENRLLKLMQNLTQNLNQLAGGEGDNQIPDTAELETARKFQEAKTESENNNLEEERGLSFISPVGLSSGLENLPGTQIDWWEDLQNIRSEFSDITLTTPKWYETTWVIVILIVGALAIGGFISWLIFRRKERPQ